MAFRQEFNYSNLKLFTNAVFDDYATDDKSRSLRDSERLDPVAR